MFVLVLAILLLPLRGWLGDAMALDAAHASVQATAAVPMQHVMHDMHGMQGMQGADGADEASEAEATVSAAPGSHPANAAHDCQSACTDCQLCHSIAVAVWPEVPMLDAAPRETPASLSVAYVSAEPAPGFKPPIL